MFYSDYHMHTNFSSDSKAPMEEMVKKSIEIGLKEIAITDHIDFDYPDKDYPFLYDYQTYQNSINFLKEKYSDKINILTGVEIGLQPHIKRSIDNLLISNSYDFIIGSTHCTDKKELCTSLYFENKTKPQAYMQYFEDVLNSAKMYDCYNVYGHLDYIIRYGTYEDKSLDYNDYKEIIDEILITIIRKDKGIEINTSGFRYGLNCTHPKLYVVKRYKELGGKIITVGSDAHSPEYIASNFDSAYNILREVGFKYITIFKNQKPIWLAI